MGANGARRRRLARAALLALLTALGCASEVGTAEGSGGQADCEPIAGAATHVEYLATLDDGRRIVVIRPEDGGSYEDFRLFQGTPEAMLEQIVMEVARQQDGGSTTIRYRVDGDEIEAFFPNQLSGDGVIDNPVTLDTPDGPLEAHREADTGPAANYQYRCLGVSG